MTAHAERWAVQAQPQAAQRDDAACRGALRVCHIASGDLWAGAEAQIATAASYLAAEPHVRVSAILLNEGRLAAELRRMGVDVTVIDEARHGSLRVLARLTRILTRNEIDIIHTHRYKESVLGSLAAKLAGVPHVIRTVHGLDEALSGWRHTKIRLYEALDRIVLWWFADVIIAVSQRMADTLRASGHRPTAVCHLHNGVALDRVRPSRSSDEVRRALGIDAGAIVVGTVGRLSPIKGHEWFLRAARRILDQEPRARFLVVGGGPLEAELVATAARLGLADRCRFLGARDDVYDLMAAMDVVALPSLDEGVPMVALEAMALSRPLVATAVGGLPEIVQHGTTGLLVPPRDDRALADACLQVARDPELARTLGAAARQAVDAGFSREANGGALVDVYRGLNVVPKTSQRRAVAPERRLHLVPPPQRTAATPAGRPGLLQLIWALVQCPAIYCARKLRHARDRYRMRRIRRHPEALVAALRGARRLLILCHGNIIRSPFAARLVAQTVGDRVSISSAGLAATAGSASHPTAVAAAQARDVDLTQHASAVVAPEAVAASDVIFVMDIPQLAAMRQRYPKALAKTFLLASLAPETPLEVRDPVDGDGPCFEACFNHIARAVQPIARILREGASR